MMRVFGNIAQNFSLTRECSGVNGRAERYMEALGDGNEECRNESDSIMDKQSQLILGVECPGSRPQSCIVGNELKTYRQYRPF